MRYRVSHNNDSARVRTVELSFDSLADAVRYVASERLKPESTLCNFKLSPIYATFPVPRIFTRAA
jgi:hypothetical protein